MLRTAGLLCVLMLLGCKQVTLQEVPEAPQIKPEFRIVNWNVAGFHIEYAGHDRDWVIANLVLEKVEMIDATVITLQEATDQMFQYLEAMLGPEWTCKTWSPGEPGDPEDKLGRDEFITCVKGEGAAFKGWNLDGTPANPRDRGWGFTTLEYLGVQITNVHLRCGGEDAGCPKARFEHMYQLYAKVHTGIVAGDFNLEDPEFIGWHQTDPDPKCGPGEDCC